MKNLFYYFIIRLTTRHALTAVKIYETIYQPKIENPVIVINNNTGSISTSSNSDNPENKKQEIIDSLGYLKSKPIKSKQDKSSISMLEGVLATMS